MKKSLCIISEYNKDYSLINLLQGNSQYELKAMLLTNSSDMPEFCVKDVTIKNSSNIDSLDLFEAIYISHNCTQDVKEYIEFAQNNGKLINLPKKIESISCVSNKYYDINVPVFVIMGSKADCGKNEVIKQIIQSMESQNENVAVVSNYENNDLLGYYGLPIDEIHNSKSVNEKILIINHYLHEIIQKSKCSALLISIPGGVCNPFFYYDCESSILTYLISKACSIDYLIYMLPGNMWEYSYFVKMNQTISNLISKTIDYWVLSSQIFDSPYFDNATNTNDIPRIVLSEETINKLYYGCNIENSSRINSQTLGEDIVKDIANKLQQQVDCYKVL